MEWMNESKKTREIECTLYSRKVKRVKIRATNHWYSFKSNSIRPHIPKMVLLDDWEIITKPRAYSTALSKNSQKSSVNSLFNCIILEIPVPPTHCFQVMGKCHRRIFGERDVLIILINLRGYLNRFYNFVSKDDAISTLTNR